jgi:hypothetical protein
MKRFNRIILPFIALVLFAACGTQKDVPYFQNAEYVDLSQSQYLYDAKIMPKDQLTITVSTTNDEAAVPFNMTVPTPYTVNSRNTYSQAMLQSYLVGNDGNIKTKFYVDRECSVEDIVNNNFKVKPLKKLSDEERAEIEGSSEDFVSVPEDVKTEDLPF